jgi:hypothetical protein
MKKQNLLRLLAAGLLIAVAMNAYGETRKDSKLLADSSDVSAPGPTGGSCSATSTDGNKTCSISCKTGQSAICSNTKTTVSCKCS